MERTVSDEYPEVTLLLRHWSNGGSALPAMYTFVASDNGSHSFTVTLKTAGSKTPYWRFCKNEIQ